MYIAAAPIAIVVMLLCLLLFNPLGLVVVAVLIIVLGTGSRLLLDRATRKASESRLIVTGAGDVARELEEAEEAALDLSRRSRRQIDRDHPLCAIGRVPR